MKNVLLTGITGQDGAYLAHLLLDNGFTVHGIIRDKNRYYADNLMTLNILDRITLHEANLFSEDWLYPIIQELDIAEIYHLAAQSSVGYSFSYPFETIKDNFNITVNIFEQVRKLNKKIKIYNAVSSEIYGNQVRLPINESSYLNPLSPYAMSKSFAYQIAIFYREQYGVFICNGILFNHESELRRGDFFINKIINNCIEISLGIRNSLEVGNINLRRDFGYAKDYVSAMYLMMQQKDADDYIVCSGESILLLDILYYILDKLSISREVIQINKALFRDSEIYEIYGDNSKIKSIGWIYDKSFYDVLDIIIMNKLKSFN